MKPRLLIAALLLACVALIVGPAFHPSAVNAANANGHAHHVGKRIVISLHAQSLAAYDGRIVVWRSLVTTGDRALPTPAGYFLYFWAPIGTPVHVVY